LLPYTTLFRSDGKPEIIMTMNFDRDIRYFLHLANEQTDDLRRRAAGGVNDTHTVHGSGPIELLKQAAKQRKVRASCVVRAEDNRKAALFGVVGHLTRQLQVLFVTQLKFVDTLYRTDGHTQARCICTCSGNQIDVVATPPCKRT